MIIDRRTALHLALGAAGLAVLSGPALAEAAPAITRIDDQTYRIATARLATELRARDPRDGGEGFPFGALTRTAYLVPLVRDGKPAGIRLLRIQPAGPLAQLGLRNGDVVRTVNGVPIGSPEQALRAYRLIKETSRLTIRVDRDGSARQLVLLLT